MQSVTGLSQAAAAGTMETAHLRVGKVTQAWSDTVAAGLVLSAGQKAGVSLRRDAAVALVISRGPKPIPVPDYTGKITDDAVAALKKAGLQVGVTEQNSDVVRKGKVISQDPKSGTLAKGGTVTLVGSSGPVVVTVPNVSRMGVRAAQAAMKDAGFKTRVKP